MARHFWLPLMFASLVNTDFNVTRNDEGDYFTRENGKDCNALTNGTAHDTGKSSVCRCVYGRTFSTENNICNRYTDQQVYYRFKRPYDDEISVSAVYAVCGEDNICALISTKFSAELPITAILGYDLPNSDSNCVVNSVEIIHDCMPRCVDLMFMFSSRSDKLYLKLHRTTPLSYLEGELFLLDITCTTDGAINKKMMFKFNGTRRLDEPGSFCNVPAYDPLKSCSDITTTACASSTSGCTVSPTSTVKVTTTIFTSSVSANTARVTPTSTARPNHADSSTTDIGIGVGLGVIVIFTIICIVICCIYRYRRRFKDRCQNWCKRPHGSCV